jgi:hypothetical protein
VSLNSKLKELADVISAAPEAFAVVPVPSLPAFAEEFVLPASVDSKHLKAAIASGLPIVLAAQISPTADNPTATDLQPFAVRATLFFQGPDQGRVACVFETHDRVAVRYSDAGGGIRATARPDDFWSI